MTNLIDIFLFLLCYSHYKVSIVKVDNINQTLIVNVYPNQFRLKYTKLVYKRNRKLKLT